MSVVIPAWPDHSAVSSVIQARSASKCVTREQARNALAGASGLYREVIASPFLIVRLQVVVMANLQLERIQLRVLQMESQLDRPRLK